MITRVRGEVIGAAVEDRIELNPLGRLVATEWAARPQWEPGLVLDLFVVMADHLHAILALPGSGNSLADVVGRFKAATSRGAARLLGQPGTIWQRSFFDRIVRDQRELDAIRKYIVENPMGR